MKLGVGYIAYSGMELLEPSIRNIRDFADFIVVVASNHSNAGDPLPPYGMELLSDMRHSGLIDHLHIQDWEIVDRAADMQVKCREKRAKAKDICEQHGCTHFLVRDCDEFHSKEQLFYLLRDHYNVFVNIDVTVSQLIEYWGTPTTRAKNLSGLWVPFIQKIQFPLGVTPHNWSRKVDRGRCSCGWSSCMEIAPSMLLMHHFTAVRYDDQEMDLKYRGHGHLNRCWPDPKSYKSHVEKLLRENETEQVEDEFGIIDYWNGKWQHYANVRTINGDEAVV